MKNPLVSIIMPVKNTVQFLEPCLDSILDQTYTNWELLAVDDSSSDDSFNILQAYSEKDSRVKPFRNDGKGIIDALRLAYSKSSGELISRMDSDDIMTQNKLEVLSSNLINNGKGNLAAGLVKYFSDTELGEGFQKYEAWLNNLIIKGNCFEEIYKECVIPSPCWMVFREDFEKCDALRPNRYPEDYDLTFRFYINGLKPIPCDIILHHWRDYATRTSRTDDNYADNTFIAIKADYFISQEYDEKKNLVVWGAGGKGKALAKILIEKNIEFHWICDNPKKIGKHIYNKEMLAISELEKIKNTQSIVTVANHKAQEEIKKHFGKLNQVAMKDYYFFC
jgi:glycosyltransferase involved in cell wall biosynthesis